MAAQRSTSFVKSLLLAQLLSVLLAVTGYTSTILASRSINLPTTQSFLNYLLLALTAGTKLLATHALAPPAPSPSPRACPPLLPSLTRPWYLYFLLALLDVQGNFLVTKAYQYTSITSVALLDCFSLPAVMLLSIFVLRVRYNAGHATGGLLCVGGLVLLVLTDSSSATGGSSPALGDALVVAGATMYAACNVGEEWLLGGAPITEFLAMMGFFGTLISGAQVAALEASALASAPWSAGNVGLMAAFATSLYLFYVLVPLVLIWGGATVLNISLLTSDMWSAAIRLLLLGGFGGTAGFFVGSLVLTGAGVVCYALSGPTGSVEDARAAAKYAPLPDEGAAGGFEELGEDAEAGWGGGRAEAAGAAGGGGAEESGTAVLLGEGAVPGRGSGMGGGSGGGGGGTGGS